LLVVSHYKISWNEPHAFMLPAMIHGVGGKCHCTRVQWVMVGNISHKCGHVWLCLPMVGTMVNTFKSMCIELYLLPAVWGRTSALTLTTAELRWSPF
jgi:hypothetical protein